MSVSATKPIDADKDQKEIPPNLAKKHFQAASSILSSVAETPNTG